MCCYYSWPGLAVGCVLGSPLLPCKGRGPSIPYYNDRDSPPVLPLDDFSTLPRRANRSPRTMKAAFLETTGAPDVIRFGDLPRPTPGDGEVLVRISAASLNPIDVYIRAGNVAMPLPKPFIPGCDLAGVVEEVGPNVKRFRYGDRVWGSNQGLLGRQGT